MKTLRLNSLARCKPLHFISLLEINSNNAVGNLQQIYLKTSSKRNESLLSKNTNWIPIPNPKRILNVHRIYFLNSMISVGGILGNRESTFAHVLLNPIRFQYEIFCALPSTLDVIRAISNRATDVDLFSDCYTPLCIEWGKEI